MATSKLTQKQKLFAQEYLVDLNATRAAQRAGYSKNTARTKASLLLANSGVQKLIQAAIQKREQRIEISQDQILIELARIGFGDPREVLSWAGNSLTLKDSNELSDGAAASIAEVVETSQGLKIKRHDKVKAIELLMRHKGMLSDKFNCKLPEAMGVASCQEKALAAQAELLRLREERQALLRHNFTCSTKPGTPTSSKKLATQEQLKLIKPESNIHKPI